MRALALAVRAEWRVSEPETHNRQANSGVGVLPLTPMAQAGVQGGLNDMFAGQNNANFAGFGAETKAAIGSLSGLLGGLANNAVEYGLTGNTTFNLINL